MIGQISPGDLPKSLVDGVIEDFVRYSVGLVRLSQGPGGTEPFLAGSGTLVSIGSIRAILTADHVTEKLPKEGRLGLVLDDRPGSPSIDIGALHYKTIARGPNEKDGPDLAAIVLPYEIASSISAKKLFYDLEGGHNNALYNPKSPNEGIWYIHGFVEELTTTEKLATGGVVKHFGLFSGFGTPEPTVVVDVHDYITMPISEAIRPETPKTFGGISGGGLWQVGLLKKADGNFETEKPILSGVCFYQENTEDRLAVKSHGPRSVYEVCVDALRK